MKKYEKLQDYLRFNGPEKLEKEFAISFKQHSLYSNLYLFKYSQIDSPMDQEIVQASRGIILDKFNDWQIVSYTYDKFFNISEGLAAKVDWSTAQVQEKLDGSLCQLYYYNKEWHIATSGTPDALGEVNGYGITFKDLFWKVWIELGYKLPTIMNICYAFELCTPYNRVVVPYKKNRLVLHGARELSNMQEIKPKSIADLYGWECIQKFEANVLETIDILDPMKQEGYVVVDANFNRVKVKSPKYVTLHHAFDGMTPRRMLEIIQKNESDEFLSYFQEFRELYDKVKDRFIALVDNTKETYDQFRDIENQKEFALNVKDLSCAGALFAVRSKKFKDFWDYYNNMNSKMLEEVLHLKELL